MEETYITISWGDFCKYSKYIKLPDVKENENDDENEVNENEKHKVLG